MYIELTETTKHTIKTKEHRNLKKKGSHTFRK